MPKLFVPSNFALKTIVLTAEGFVEDSPDCFVEDPPDFLVEGSPDIFLPNN
jgi:hypothetical protein